jgi:putative hydrolase of the HAD superfamily
MLQQGAVRSGQGAHEQKAGGDRRERHLVQEQPITRGIASCDDLHAAPIIERMPTRVLAFDGDDTLWHNESRFQLTQGALRELVRRHVPDADVDGHLFEVEMRNLALFGYGVKAFTLSMLETAIQLTDGRIPASDLEVILGWGKRMLGEPTELLDGVYECLLDVSARYSLLLITKGDLFDQESKLARSGLAELFAGVEILSDKTVDSYRSLMKRRDIRPDRFDDAISHHDRGFRQFTTRRRDDFGVRDRKHFGPQPAGQGGCGICFRPTYRRHENANHRECNRAKTYEPYRDSHQNFRRFCLETVLST